MKRATAVVLCVLGWAVALGALPEAAGAAPPGGAEKWALLIGVDRHQGRTRPNTGSVGDVEEMRTVLERSGWPRDHIRTLTDGGATAGAIRDGLRWLVQRSGDRTFSMVHYSGHVQQKGRTEYLWPHDNKLIPDTDLANEVRQLKGWSWINIAGCEAAGFDEGISGPQRLFTASSRANEKSYEMPPDHRNSVFSYFLADQGMLKGYADRNRDGRVSVHEGFQYAAERAPGMTSKQRYGPQHPVLKGGDGAEWFLDPPPPPPPPPPPAKPGGGLGCLLFCRR